jgi:hypothetical protein
MTEPRCAHYQLAHVALRSVAFQDPLGFLSLMASEKAREVLASLLEQVSEHCSGDVAFDANDVAIHRVRLLGSPCLVVEMPVATVPPEAHFVGVWLAINDGPETAQIRYFTLEAAADSYATRTVLGEWDEEGKHVNYGVGPEPSLEGFVQSLTALVARYH